VAGWGRRQFDKAHPPRPLLLLPLLLPPPPPPPPPPLCCRPCLQPPCRLEWRRSRGGEGPRCFQTLIESWACRKKLSYRPERWKRQEYVEDRRR
jgi:hypothetical protein